MQIGIGLPNAVRGVDKAGIVEWAQRAERTGFASLGTIDRVAYPSFEPLISLAAAAAVTERIELVTDILIAPLRTNTALLAEQAATVDQLSGGRLTLGLALGAREDDYEASGVDYNSRGKLFDEQLAELRRLWSGEGGVGPSPVRERPGLLIGGSVEAAFRRTAEYADGWTMGGGTPDQLAGARETLYRHWTEMGRAGDPRRMALFYYSLGDDAEATAREKIGDYYAFLGDYADQVVESVATSPDMVRAYLKAFDGAGATDVICFPASADPGQVELLAEAADLSPARS